VLSIAGFREEPPSKLRSTVDADIPHVGLETAVDKPIVVG